MIPIKTVIISQFCTLLFVQKEIAFHKRASLNKCTKWFQVSFAITLKSVNTDDSEDTVIRALNTLCHCQC